MDGPAWARRLIGAHYRERVNLFEFEGRRPTVHPEAFVAPTATPILDGARLGAGSLVAAGSTVSPGTEIPAGVLAAGAPARVRKPIEGTAAQPWVNGNPSYYAELAQRHRAGVAPAPE